MERFTLSSSAFTDGTTVPARYTCDGENINPPLTISGVPSGAKTLALIMEDPDVPQAVRDDRMFDHWILFNIDPKTTFIDEGEAPGTLGTNTAGDSAYRGPCPPPQFEPAEHRYIFQLYALAVSLDVREGATKEAVKSAMKGHILEKAELLGRYRRA